jgi:hypothetical protein
VEEINKTKKKEKRKRKEPIFHQILDTMQSGHRGGQTLQPGDIKIPTDASSDKT